MGLRCKPNGFLVAVPESMGSATLRDHSAPSRTSKDRITLHEELVL